MTIFFKQSVVNLIVLSLIFTDKKIILNNFQKRKTKTSANKLTRP